MTSDQLFQVKAALDLFRDVAVRISITPDNITFRTVGLDSVEVAFKKANDPDLVILCREHSNETFNTKHILKLIKVAKIAKTKVMLTVYLNPLRE